MPAGCAALTFRVAPTFSVSVPPVKVPFEPEGLLVKLVTVIVFEPLVMVRAEEGKVTL